MRRFGESIAARARGEEPPEGGYQGEYVTELAQRDRRRRRHGRRRARAPRRGADDGARCARRSSASACGSTASSPSASCTTSGEVDAAIERLARGGHVYESEGATWLRTSAFGDDKDRVLRRSTRRGRPTSPPTSPTTSDKRERGYDRLIDVLGRRPPRLRVAHEGRLRGAGRRPRQARAADHAARATCSSAASARRCRSAQGEFVTLDDLIDDIGVDAARFFMLQRSHDTTLDLDLRARARAVARRTPSTTCSTRTRASRASCARRGRSACSRRSAARPGARRRAAAPVGARAREAAAGAARRGAAGGRARARRTG